MRIEQDQATLQEYTSHVQERDRVQTALVSNPAPLPPVYVMPTKYLSAARNLQDTNANAGILPLDSFKLAFENIHETDAHFLAYCIINSEMQYEPGPRCSKPLLPKIRIAGADIMMTQMVLDYDNPGHKGWGATREERDTNRGIFLSQLSDVADKWPLAWEWSLLYFTRNGARLVYVLNAPMTCEEFEGKHQWLCQEFNRQGVAIDCGVSDWTRCFRLPYVLRDKEMTWESDYAEMFFQYDNRIDATEMPTAISLKRTNSYGEIQHYDNQIPDLDHARTLTEFKDPHGNWLQTDWYKNAKRRLKGRECFDCLFSHKSLSVPGSRNKTLHQFTGQAISLLYYLDGTEPQHIFGLFLPVVEQLDPDNDTPDWIPVLWDHIQRLWAKEEAKDVKVNEIEIEKAEAAQSNFGRIVQGMRSWCTAPELHVEDENVAYAFAIRRLIVSCGKGFYVMGRNGYYDPIQLNKDQIIPRVRALELDGVIETKVMGQDGAMRDIQATELLNTYATIVKEIKAIAEIEGAKVEGMDTPNATLVVPSYKRNKELTPEFNLEVDEWLHHFFGENYDLGCKWIGWSLAWDEGCICALSLEGRAGSGKKMLVQGLSECLELPYTATADDLIGEYQYGLLRSPFLAVNEGWPNLKGHRHPADSFRAMVSADPFPCNAKFMQPVVARNPVRVIFTANNLEVVKQLSGNRDLSPEDREALAIRLLHLRINDIACDWLRMKGGTKLTARPGHRWITGDAGEQSDFVLAKHFLWLHKERKGPIGSRFLVEGNNDQEVMFDMRTQSGASPIVIETLIHLLDKKPIPSGVAFVGGELYVCTADVLSHHRSDFAEQTRDKLNIQLVSKVFKSISKKVPDQAFELPTKEKSGRKRWYQVDCALLLRVAQRDGWSSARLEQIVKEQEDRKAGVFDGSAAIAAAARAQLEREANPPRIIDFGLAVRDLRSLPS